MVGFAGMVKGKWANINRLLPKIYLTPANMFWQGIGIFSYAKEFMIIYSEALCFANTAINATLPISTKSIQQKEKESFTTIIVKSEVETVALLLMLKRKNWKNRLKK